MVRSFISNTEFQNRTNPLFITLLYYTILVRPPGVRGLAFWTGVANPGVPGVFFSNLQAAIEVIRLILGPCYGGSAGFLGSAEWQGLLFPGAPPVCPMLP